MEPQIIDDESYSHCILEDIALFKCVKCNKIDNYVNDDNLCEVCDRSNEWFPEIINNNY